MLMCAKDYLLHDMEDVTSKTHNDKFMTKKLYAIIDEIKEKYGIVVIAVVHDGAGEYRMRMTKKMKKLKVKRM